MSETTTLQAELVITEEAIQKILASQTLRHTTAEVQPIKATEKQHIAVAVPNTVTETHKTVTPTERQHTTTAVEAPRATTVETSHATATEPQHVTATQPQRATAVETPHAVAENRPIITLGTEPFAVAESKMDFASVLLYNAAQVAGFTKGFEVVTHRHTVCDLVFTDDQGRKMTAYVKEKNDNPEVILDTEGFKGTKECTKKTDAIIKYLTEHGVKVRAKRSVHNRPQGVLRPMINKQKAKKAKQKASKEAVHNYLTGVQNTPSTRQQQQQ